MAGKVLGLSFGRTMGNTEILVREALMGAEAAGAKVSLIRAHDYDIKPCNGCSACMSPAAKLSEKGLPVCVRNRNDDFLTMAEQIIEADGLIFGSPIYEMTPVGLYRLIADRIGPFYDLAGNKMKQDFMGKENYPLHEEFFKPRVCGFICVGGAERFKYMNMALPNMNILTYPLLIVPVDQLLVGNSTGQGDVLKQDDALIRANQMGHNVFSMLGRSYGETTWFGPEGTCPVCHNDMMIVGKQSPVMCAICGIEEELTEKAGSITVTFSDDQQKQARITMEEKITHMNEIFAKMQELAPFKEQIPEKIKKYKDHQIKIVKP